MSEDVNLMAVLLEGLLAAQASHVLPHVRSMAGATVAALPLPLPLVAKALGASSMLAAPTD